MAKRHYPIKHQRFGTIYPHAWNYQIVVTVSNMVLKNIFSRNWKTKNKIFLLIKVTRVASTSISNCCLIFGNVFTSEGARTIFDFPVVLELVQLLVGLWVSFTFNFWFMFKNSDFSRSFFKGQPWKYSLNLFFLCNPYNQLHAIKSVIFRFKFFNFAFNFLPLV